MRDALLHSVIAPRASRRLWALVVCLIAALALQAVTRATEHGRVVRVRSAAELQAALMSAQPGSTIALAPGVRYVGNFVLPVHDGDDWITVTTGGVLPDRRVAPSDSGALAILQSPSVTPALRAAPGARRWRVVGLEIAPSGGAQGTSIEIGSPVATRLEDVPGEIVLDRLLVRGDPERGQKRGLSLHGRDVTVTRSYISDIKQPGEDTQAIWANNGPGPYTIRDNYLEAAGENVLFGGDTPHIANLVPSDITIEDNTIAKPLAWQTQHWDVKNLLELKAARHAVIRHNTFSGNWVSAQAGYSILFSPRNQYGAAPWTVVEDVRFEGNQIRDVSSGINIAGDDDEHPSQRTNHIAIVDNLVVADRGRFGGDARFLMMGRGPQQVTIERNTAITNGTSWIYTYKGGALSGSAGLVVRDNLALQNKYGFMAEGAGVGRAALMRFYPNAVFEGNVIAGGSAGDYPPGNLFPSVAEFEAQFVDAARGDYRLKPGSAFAGKGAAVAKPR